MALQFFGAGGCVSSGIFTKESIKISFELVQGKVFAGLVNAGLLFSTASYTLGCAELFAEQHERRQDKTQGAEKITNNDSHG